MPLRKLLACESAARSDHSSWAGNWQVACRRFQKVVKGLILHQGKQQGATLLVCFAVSSFENSHSDGLYEEMWDVKVLRFNRVVTKQWGSWSQSQVLPNGFLLLHLNSDHRSGLCRTSVLNTHTHTHALCAAALTLSVKKNVLVSQLSLKVRSHAGMVCTSISVHLHFYVYGNVGVDAMSIFSPVHRVLPLCCAVLFLWNVARVTRSSGSPGQLQLCTLEPDLPAPTPVGETYKIPGQHLGEAICKKRGPFLMDVFSPLSLSLSGD